jgi:hypothetical protein
MAHMENRYEIIIFWSDEDAAFADHLMPKRWRTRNSQSNCGLTLRASWAVPYPNQRNDASYTHKGAAHLPEAVAARR